MKYKYPNNLCKLASAKLLSEANKHIKKMNPGIIGKLKQFLTGRNVRNENAIQAIKKYKEINKPMKLSKSLETLEKKAFNVASKSSLRNATLIGSAVGALGGGAIGAASGDKEHKVRNALIGAGVGAGAGAGAGRFGRELGAELSLAKKIKNKTGMGLFESAYHSGRAEANPFYRISPEKMKKFHKSNDLTGRFARRKKFKGMENFVDSHGK